MWEPPHRPAAWGSPEHRHSSTVRQGRSKRSSYGLATDKAVDSDVFVRLRPLLPDEVAESHTEAWTVRDAKTIGLLAQQMPTEGLSASHAFGMDEHYQRLLMETVRQQRAAVEEEAYRRRSSAVQGGAVVSRRHRLDNYDTSTLTRGAGRLYHALAPVRRLFQVNGSVLGSETTNAEVYERTAQDGVLAATEGVTHCFMAYGQTRSGKGHTVMGNPETPGIIPQALFDLMDHIRSYNTAQTAKHRPLYQQGFTEAEFLVRCHYVEVYCDNVIDLLRRPAPLLLQPRGMTPCRSTSCRVLAGSCLQIRENPRRGFFLEGVEERLISDEYEILDAVANAYAHRKFARTSWDGLAARSHAVFCVTVETCHSKPSPKSTKRTSLVNDMRDRRISSWLHPDEMVINEGKLFVAELAGSENHIRHFDQTAESLAEGRAVSKSLFQLSEVISKLGEQSRLETHHAVNVPYRASTLTKLLHPALAAQGRLSVVVTLHPSHKFTSESIFALLFAEKAARIRRQVGFNTITQDRSVLQRFKSQMKMLKNELRSLVHSDRPVSPPSHPRFIDNGVEVNVEDEHQPPPPESERRIETLQEDAHFHGSQTASWRDRSF
ncbi:unnamed protein product [Vitrella brassicaformis CCMP3155]|uniref:Kinesin motor domain-containing protein n=1 Tax=Vitrella brassicaformis (strain CCMP3155) TaxID=1169540 RepID=A0A0G4EQJ0_VITBC|nr:unnamed protein product [Vitrella brassicaformis CCMP3155]|eukprot:CEL99498.1 unnamed protein product [Vitrella brassicaformis CCMP3155]